MPTTDTHRSIERNCQSQHTRITAALNSVAVSVRRLLTNRQNQYSDNRLSYECLGAHHHTYGSIPIELTNADHLTEAQPIYEARKSRSRSTT